MNFSYEITNKNFNNQLLECSILAISLLLKQYKAKAIDINDFKRHTTNKISYILNNISNIQNSMEKTNIESLINECMKITKVH